MTKCSRRGMHLACVRGWQGCSPSGNISEAGRKAPPGLTLAGQRERGSAAAGILISDPAPHRLNSCYQTRASLHHISLAGTGWSLLLCSLLVGGVGLDRQRQIKAELGPTVQFTLNADSTTCARWPPSAVGVFRRSLEMFSAVGTVELLRNLHPAAARHYVLNRYNKLLPLAEDPAFPANLTIQDMRLPRRLCRLKLHLQEPDAAWNLVCLRTGVHAFC